MIACATAGLLHWFVGPYVHKLWFHAPSERVKVQVLSVFAQPRCERPRFLPSLLHYMTPFRTLSDLLQLVCKARCFTESSNNLSLTLFSGLT